MSISVEKCWLGPIVVACALVASPALAQSTASSGFAVNRFEPSGGGSEWFSLESLDFRGHLRPAAGLVADLAIDPVVIYDANGHRVTSLVSHQGTAHADLALVLWGRLRLDLNAPVVFWHDGTSGAVNGVSYASPTGEILGDVRAGADVRLFGQPGDGITMAVGAQVFLPTGHESAFTSDGAARVWPRLLAAGVAGPIVWAARVGYHVRPTYKCTCSLAPGSEVTGGLALGIRPVPTMLLGAELYASSAVTGGGFAKSRTSPMEALLGVHAAVAPDWTIGAGVAPGTEGAGSPSWRFVFGLQYYPAIAEAARPSAPPPSPPVVSPPAPRPAPPKPKPAAPAKPAAPPPPAPPPPPPPPPGDRDHDGVVDPEDACPDVPGPRNDDPVRNGCPIVRIEGGQIRIREQVKFKTDSAVILKESDYILQGVVKILKETPEIKKMRVEGHTDTQGKPAHNKRLSQKRAASVVKWLVKHGVAKKRLTSAGFGQDRPIATNQTEDGRRENRRVELHIVDGPGGER
jgi:outer membrane protein OmpA-like peptidoglycan-associated protein